MEIRACCGQTARIAYQGENDRMQVRFDISDIMAEFPGGVAALTVRRPGDTEAVASNSAVLDGTDLVWTVSAWECERQGFLYAQIVYSAGETVAKTKIYRFSVSESLITSVDPEPDDWADWVGELMTAAAATQAAVDSYDAMTATATGLPAGSTPTAEMDHSGENPVLELGIPAGNDGYTPQRGVDYWTEEDQAAMRQDISDDLAAARQAITEEKVAAVGAVETAGTTQVGLVTAEGTTQKAAVVAKGEEVLESIPSDYTELSNDVSDLKNAIDDKQDAPAVAGTAGQVLSLDSNLDPVWTDQTGGASEYCDEQIEFTKGGYINTAGTTAPQNVVYTTVALSYAVVPCEPGDKFVINGNSNGVARLWAFTDASDNVLSVADEGASGTNLVKEAPAGSAWCIINVNQYDPLCYKRVTPAEAVENLNTEKAPEIVETASGEIADWSDGAEEIPVEHLNLQLSCSQEGEGNPTPTNVRSITGVSSALVAFSGANLLDRSKETVGKRLTATGTLTNNTAYCTSEYILVKPGMKIYGRMLVASGNGYAVCEYAKDKTFIQYQLAGSGTAPNSKEYTLSASTWFIRVSYHKSNGAPAVLYPSTLTDVLPGRHENFAYTFDNAVYGGTLDAVSGVMVEDWGSMVLNGTGATITNVSTNRWTVEFASDTFVYVRTSADYIKCDKLTPISASAAGSAEYKIAISGAKTLNLQLNSSITTQEGVAEWLSQNTPRIVYKALVQRATKFTPHPVKTVLGVGHAWSDVGTMEVVYRADTELFVQKSIPSVPVQDVRVNVTSVLTNGVADVPVAASETLGAVKASSVYGISLVSGVAGMLCTSLATDAMIKEATNWYKPIGVRNQHHAVFYGLAKAAGDSTQSSSNNAVGTYTESALSAISQMLNAPVSVSGSTPSITAKPGVRYVCGEVSTLTIVLPASGCIDVVFESGSTATVLTITPPTGVTVKWANGFDPTSLDANTTYEINIMDGLGVACSWT